MNLKLQTDEEVLYAIQAFEARARAFGRTSHGGRICEAIAERIKRQAMAEREGNGTSKTAGVDSSKFKEY